MYIEAGLVAFDRDAIAGPDTRFEIDVTLVLLWPLLPHFGEAEFRMRAVLRGVIAANLVIGAAVGGAQVDVFVLVALQPEGDANETACAFTGATGGPSRQLHFDLTVVKSRAFYDRVCLSVRYLAIFNHLYGSFSHVLDRLQLDSVRSQLIGRLSGD